MPSQNYLQCQWVVIIRLRLQLPGQLSKGRRLQQGRCRDVPNRTVNKGPRTFARCTFSKFARFCKISHRQGRPAGRWPSQVWGPGEDVVAIQDLKALKRARHRNERAFFQAAATDNIRPVTLSAFQLRFPKQTRRSFKQRRYACCKEANGKEDQGAENKGRHGIRQRTCQIGM